MNWLPWLVGFGVFTAVMIAVGLWLLLGALSLMAAEEYEEPTVWEIRTYMELLKQFDYHYPPLDALNPEEREVFRRVRG